MPETTS